MSDDKTVNLKNPLPRQNNSPSNNLIPIRKALELADKDIHNIRMDLLLEELNGDNSAGIWWPN
jgi:hypothetical protein